MSASPPAAAGDSRIRAWLRGSSDAAFSIYAVAAAFGVYFCMYAFRKPFAVASYEGASALGMDLKDALVVSQVVGYALSKFLGMKFCSEINPAKRGIMLVGLILWAELALVLFGVLPASMKIFAIFLNGLPLGMVWGLVFGFLEGRRTSDLLGAGLSCSYIVASGAVKGVGQSFLSKGISEDWMPAITGLCFALPFLIAVWLLTQLPPPTTEDVELRSNRGRLDSSDRWAFLKNNWWGMLPLLILYFFLTALRDYRDSFAKEIWGEFDLGADAMIYAEYEIYIAFTVLAILAGIYFVKGNRVAVIAMYVMMIAGMSMVGLATLLFDYKMISPTAWMTSVGLGLYLAYVPYGCVFFDRLVAMLRSNATCVFAIYLADFVGYTGVVCVVLYKQFGEAGLSKYEFFRGFTYFTSILCVVCFLWSAVSFLRRPAPALE